MKKKQLLITGGAGFIGSQFAKMAGESGYQTIVLDNLSRGRIETVQSSEFISEFIQGELEDAILLDSIFKKFSIDAVVHFAAFIDVGESCRHPGLYYKNNVSATIVLLEAMIRHGVKRCVFSSSAAIFGTPDSSSCLSLAEDHPSAPINPYGHSKWMVETILKDYWKAHGLSYCCLRYFNAAGGDPEGRIKYCQPRPTNLIPLLLKSLKTNSPFTVFGSDYPTHDGTCIRDYIHVEDLGRAHLLALKKLWNSNGAYAYNLGNGKGYSVLEVIQAVEKTLGMLVPFQIGPRREGDPPILVANASKALAELGWTPQYASLEKMVEHAWIAL